MNPFGWGGPQFLAFYAGLCLLMLFGARALRRRLELGAEPPGLLTDPYVIATLRGGKNEALRVCVVSLLDRRLLRRAGKEDLVTSSVGVPESVRRPIERALLAHFVAPRAATSIFDDAAVTASSRGLEEELARARLVVDARARALRFVAILPFLVVALGLGVARLQSSVAAGRHNVGLLLVLMLFTSLFLFAGVLRKRTHRGDAALGDLRSLFGPLRQRRASIDTGGQTSEVAFVAAVYGLGFLPAELAFARDLYQQAIRSGTDAAPGAIGDVESPSCGAGSSCGGGGCGGGCGGCGS